MVDLISWAFIGFAFIAVSFCIGSVIIAPFAIMKVLLERRK